MRIPGIVVDHLLSLALAGIIFVVDFCGTESYRDTGTGQICGRVGASFDGSVMSNLVPNAYGQAARCGRCRATAISRAASELSLRTLLGGLELG